MLNGRCDSFVVETDVHYPTDINLLFDAMRKTIEVCAKLCAEQGVNDWRHSAYNIRKLKKLYRRAAHQAFHVQRRDEARGPSRRNQTSAPDLSKAGQGVSAPCPRHLRHARA